MLWPSLNASETGHCSSDIVPAPFCKTIKVERKILFWMISFRVRQFLSLYLAQQLWLLTKGTKGIPHWAFSVEEPRPGAGPHKAEGATVLLYCQDRREGTLATVGELGSSRHMYKSVMPPLVWEWNVRRCWPDGLSVSAQVPCCSPDPPLQALSTDVRIYIGIV